MSVFIRQRMKQKLCEHIKCTAKSSLVTAICKKVDTATEAYKPVITELIGKIWSTNHLSILISIAILLS